MTHTETQPEVWPHLSLDFCLNSTIILEWEPITAYYPPYPSNTHTHTENMLYISAIETRTIKSPDMKISWGSDSKFKHKMLPPCVSLHVFVSVCACVSSEDIWRKKKRCHKSLLYELRWDVRPKARYRVKASSNLRAGFETGGRDVSKHFFNFFNVSVCKFDLYHTSLHLFSACVNERSTVFKVYAKRARSSWSREVHLLENPAASGLLVSKQLQQRSDVLV